MEAGCMTMIILMGILVLSALLLVSMAHTSPSSPPNVWEFLMAATVFGLIAALLITAPAGAVLGTS